MRNDALRVSAKTGLGVTELLEELIVRIPAPVGDVDAPLQALIIDSWFDNYLGVVSLVRVMQGKLTPRTKIKIMSIGKSHHVDKVGIFTPKPTDMPDLKAGDVGFVVAGIKEIDGAPVGDTITNHDNPALTPLPGFKAIQPQVETPLQRDVTARLLLSSP